MFSDDEAEDDGKVEALAKVKLEEETEKDEGKDAMDETPDEV